MHIGIDARFFGGSFAKGLGRYTEKLLIHLDQLNPPHRFTVFLRKENWDLFQPTHPEKFTKVPAPFRWYSIEEQIRLPSLIKQQRVDLMHFPHFNVPMFSRVPFVVTIHDLIITHYPTTKATTLGPAIYALKQLGYVTVIRHAVKKSRKIIAVSEFTKKDILNSFAKGSDKIEVTYEAAETPKNKISPDQSERALAKFSIHSPYILYVGNAYPHKNIEGLLRAFRMLKRRYEQVGEEQIMLVLVGKEDYFYRRTKHEARALGIWDDVRFTDYVNDDELAALYQHALVYCFPSYYEGFGLPPLEAMSYGVPVVSSDRSCLPEILGDAAIYVNPDDIEQMAKILYDISHDEAKRDLLRQRGLDQVQKYSWERCARETLAIYEKALH